MYNVLWIINIESAVYANGFIGRTLTRNITLFNHEKVLLNVTGLSILQQSYCAKRLKKI